jgi:hypothetical protein
MELIQVQILQTGKQLHPVEVHQMDLAQEVHLEMAVTDQTLAGEVVAADLRVMVEILHKDQALAEVHLQMAARVEHLLIKQPVVLAAVEEHMDVQAAAVAVVDIQAAAEAHKPQLHWVAAADHS